MAYISKGEAKGILDNLGVAYEPKSSREELIEIIETIGGTDSDSITDEEPIALEQHLLEPTIEVPIVLKKALDEAPINDEQHDESECGQKLNKDGFIPGQPVTFQQIVAMRKKKGN